MRNILSTMLVVMLMATSIFAAPLKNVPCTLVQPNGQIINCFVSGDEFFNYYHDANGYTIIQDRETGYYTYAVRDGLNIVASTYVVGTVNPETTAALTPNVLMDPTEIRAKREAHYRLIEQNRPQGTRTSNTGTLNNIVVFISFANGDAFSHTYSQVYNMLNDTTTPQTVSMKNYYKTASYNQLSLNSHLFPPSDSSNLIYSYQDSHTRSYYMPESTTNPDGYLDYEGRIVREHTLLDSALRYISSMVPSSLDIDNDDDYYVDNVIFVVASDVAGWNDLLWPHRSALYDRYVYINGRRVYDYNFMLEGSAGNFDVSTFCHEMFHSLTAPDLYDYNYTYSPFVGAWDLMENNQTPPQQMSAYMKYQYGQWIDEIPEAEEDGVYTIHSVATSPNCAYKIYPDRNAFPHQYLVVEYRNKNNAQDASALGTGAVIYRVNDIYEGNTYVDYSLYFAELYAYRNGCYNLATDPSYETGGNINKSYFNANSPAIPEFSQYSDPRPFFANGSMMPNIRLTDFRSAGDSLTFRLVRHETVIDTFPWQESFENLTIPYYFTQQYTNNYTHWRTRTGNQNSSISTAHTGNKNASFYGTTSGTTKLISPIFDFTFLADPVLSFWYGTSGTASYTLKVYYKNSASAEWTLLQSYNNVTSGWTQQTLSLPNPSSTYYVAFEATGANGAGIILDDIQISGTAITEFTITASAGAHGQISPAGSVVVPTHGTQVFNITPEENYTVDQLLVDGADQGQRLSYTFENVVAAHSIEASFKIANPSLNVNPTSLFFSTAVGDTSASKSVFVSATDIIEGIAVSVEQPFMISSDASPWCQQLYLPYNGGMLYVRFAPGGSGNVTSNINISGAGLTANVALTGNGTGIESYNDKKVQLFPNPVENTLQLIFEDNNLPDRIEIYDICGRLILLQNITNQSTTINVSHLNSGVYFVKANDIVKKFVKK